MSTYDGRKPETPYGCPDCADLQARVAELDREGDDWKVADDTKRLLKQAQDPVPDRGCDEPGCGLVAICGWPSDGGYRRTCGIHYRADLAPQPEPAGEGEKR